MDCTSPNGGGLEPDADIADATTGQQQDGEGEVADLPIGDLAAPAQGETATAKPEDVVTRASSGQQTSLSTRDSEEPEQLEQNPTILELPSNGPSVQHMSSDASSSKKTEDDDFKLGAEKEGLSRAPPAVRFQEGTTAARRISDDDSSTSDVPPPTLFVTTSSGGGGVSVLSEPCLTEKQSDEVSATTVPAPVLMRAGHLQRSATPGAVSVAGSTEILGRVQEGVPMPDGPLMRRETPADLLDDYSNQTGDAPTVRAELVDDATTDSELRRLQEMNETLIQQLREARTVTTTHVAEAVVVQGEVSEGESEELVRQDGRDEGDDESRDKKRRKTACFIMVCGVLGGIVGMIVIVVMVRGNDKTPSTGEAFVHQAPTLRPSLRPTVVPSFNPSSGPSGSVAPSDVPSDTPSNEPSSSMSPSQLPSSAVPTISMEPSLPPSQSMQPSDHPSDAPSDVPSQIPSPNTPPTARPTMRLLSSGTPSSAPDIVQPAFTESPVQSPTERPVVPPTPAPSLPPTRQPSPPPTPQPLTPLPPPPTFSPSPAPSPQPTARPTSSPTNQPVAPECFEERVVLERAVELYERRPEPDNDISQRYGYPINNWCVGRISNFRSVFEDRTAFNEDISDWDMSSATVLSNMFSNANKFNQDLTKWDVSNTQDMSYMFGQALQFNGDISSWDVSRVTSMQGMFNTAQEFNRPLSSWTITSLRNARAQFGSTPVFNQDLCSWGPVLRANNVDVSGMFVNEFGFFKLTGCPVLENPNMTANPVSPVCHACG